MNTSRESNNKEGVPEKGARFMRNINALGAAAIGGAALLIPDRMSYLLLGRV